jgi:hypothetical protein
MKYKTMKLMGLAILAGALTLSSCSNSSDGKTTTTGTATVNDAAYFEAAKQYLTYNTTFGPQTDLTSHQYRKKIEFSNTIQDWGNPYGSYYLADVLTARKTFVANTDNTLIMLKRIQASRKDETTMTVGLRSGNNRSRVYDAITATFVGNRSRSYVVDQCERIVFNALGVAACLNLQNGSVVMTKLSQKFSHRLISSCQTGGSTVSCSGSYGHKTFSRKSLDLNTNLLTVDPLSL